jgi:hypothetical protein
MLLVVRDEADLIREWVAFHATLGVDSFFVTDHRSTDGTSEALVELADRYEIYLTRRVDPLMRQGAWMTEMATLARTRHGIDWVVPSDADEFWVPESGSLREAVSTAAGRVLCARRANVLPDRAAVSREGYRFFHNLWRVARPFPPHEGRPDPDDELEWPLFLRELPGKILCSTEGLSEIPYGNHDVNHVESRRSPAPVEILHFPVRGFPDFERQTVGHGQSASLDRTSPPGRTWHQKRLFRIWQRGRLRDAYGQLLDQVETHRVGESPRLVADDRIWRAVSPETVPDAAVESEPVPSPAG